MKNIFIILIIIIFIVSCASVDNSIYILTDNHQNKYIEEYFKVNDIKYSFTENYYILFNNDKIVSKLLDLLIVQRERIDINLINIENINNTRNTEGSYYKRQYLELKKGKCHNFCVNNLLG